MRIPSPTRIVSLSRSSQRAIRVWSNLRFAPVAMAASMEYQAKSEVISPSRKGWRQLRKRRASRVAVRRAGCAAATGCPPRGAPRRRRPSMQRRRSQTRRSSRRRRLQTARPRRRRRFRWRHPRVREPHNVDWMAGQSLRRAGTCPSGSPRRRTGRSGRAIVRAAQRGDGPLRSRPRVDPDYHERASRTLAWTVIPGPEVVNSTRPSPAAPGRADP